MRDFLEQLFHNSFLWSPLAMAIGAALYFSMPTEPAVSYPWLIAGLAAAILIFRRTDIIIASALLFIFGFAYAAGFARLTDTPQLSHNLRNIQISGIVQDIDYTDGKTRIFLKTSDIAAGKTAVVRLSAAEDKPVPRIGETIKARVFLFRPSGPFAPESFDYARWAYFNKISATGYLTDYEIISESRTSGINSLRNYMRGKTNSFLSDALVLGYKNAVPKDEAKIWTASGIGHVWSISGFHMTLVSGWLFLLFYTIFRLIPAITRRIPAKYPAMACAWAGLAFYLLISGLDVATIRAFLMTTLIFAAFIFGRNVFSLRNICIVFFAVFLINPHYVMQPGFQLSFSAIFGLAWFFKKGWRGKTTFWQKLLNIAKAAIMTSIIASLFTAPFVAYHFNSLPIYSLVGNLVLLPVFSFAVMPLVMLGTISALFGFTLPLDWSADIYEFALAVANKIAGLPYAQIQLPAISGGALLLLATGLACLMFIESRRRINIMMFCIFTALGIAAVAFQKKPLFYATSDHELVAFVHDGKLEFNKTRSANHYFAFDSWKLLNFEKIETGNKRRKCDAGLCIYTTKNWTAAYVQKYVPLSKNIASLCADSKIDFIISYYEITAPKCDYKILRGGFVIYESGRIKYTPYNRGWHIPR
ncbi:MAG: ComEC family competence protein [Rickettsiales bacterium]|jgi:competence protein ComEC|nr:ComEC family competence protein [Rickettsiales bacterium]